MEGKKMKTDEIIKRLDIIIEQNNNIIKQDYFRAKHIATIKKDTRIVATIILISVLLSFLYGILIGFGLYQ